MIIQDLLSIKKHLDGRSPHHLSRCYLLTMPDDYERGKAVKILFSYLVSQGSAPVLFSGSEIGMKELYDALQSPSLFGGESVIFLDDVEKMNKNSKQVEEAIEQIEMVSKEAASNAQEVAAASEEQIASTEEIVNAAKELAEMANNLSDNVNKFNL
jgi:DNA polymerase III delta subunit